MNTHALTTCCHPHPCRRQFDLTLGLDTLTPITTIHERVKVWGEQSGKHIDLQVRGNTTIPGGLCCASRRSSSLTP